MPTYGMEIRFLLLLQSLLSQTGGPTVTPFSFGSNLSVASRWLVCVSPPFGKRMDRDVQARSLGRNFYIFKYIHATFYICTYIQRSTPIDVRSRGVHREQIHTNVFHNYIFDNSLKNITFVYRASFSYDKEPEHINARLKSTVIFRLYVFLS